MAKIDNPSEIRKCLLEKGYTPLPAYDKHCFLEKWPQVVVTEDLIDRRWSRMSQWLATAMRLDRLVMVDLDVTHQQANELIHDRWRWYFPYLFASMDVPLLQRGTTASCKLAFFFRATETFGVIRTRRYLAPGATSSDDAQHVEIFGGASARYAGAYGAHGRAPDGRVLSEYVWRADQPLDIPYGDLPELTKKEAGELCDIADRVFQELGFTPVQGSKGGEHKGENWIYTLTDDMRFDCLDDVTRSLSELKEVARGPDGMRCSASWLEATSVNRTRCIARYTSDGRFFVIDFDTDDRHQEKSEEPEPLPDLDELFPELEKLGGAEPPPDAGARLWAAWIRANYAFCRNLKNAVVPLDATHLAAGISLVNFRLSHANHCDQIVSGNGKVSYINPVDIWLRDKGRINVEGLAMRPDMRTPIYADEGFRWVNIYKPVAHTASGGSAALGIELMEQIAPEGSEQDWFRQWLAYKYRHPDVPGPAVISVANDRFGTGRGAMVKLMGRLFGQRYVRTIPFHVFAGKSSQAQYTNWMAETLIVAVNETTELGGQSTYAARHDVEAHIRDLIEPRASPREIIVKGVSSRQLMSYCTFFIATNSLAAFPLTDADRRCGVLTSGENRTQKWWDDVHAWMDDPANIAAFAEWLLSINLIGYSPYAPPPMTEGKEQMVEAAKSDLDRGLDIVLEAIRGRSEVFSMRHVTDGMDAVRMLYALDYPLRWESTIGKIVAGRGLHRIGTRNGKNWHPLIDGTRVAVYSWEMRTKKRWSNAGAQELQIELARCGATDGTFGSQIINWLSSEPD